MPDVPITLTPWFDAKDNPPEDARAVWSNRGDAWFDGGAWRRLITPSDSRGTILTPQPSVWCDPSPPDGDDPLTHRGLALLVAFVETEATDGWAEGLGREVRHEAARLRRALDAIGTT